MSDNEEEEDYMSDKFLAKSVHDVRPGLITNRAKQREIKVDKKAKLGHESQKEKHNLLKRKAETQLELGLKQALTSENKGFALLQKMGYKQGDPLGKGSKGIVEPIAINIKTDRKGLGRKTALEELEIKKQQIKIKKLKSCENATEEFRKRMIQKNEERFIGSALRKCQSACVKLDSIEKITKPAMKWFWPEKLENSDTDNESSDEDDDECDQSEKLEMLVNYLRTAYNYCNWCGIHYEDNEDLCKNCPGPQKEDHDD